jgi:hypothetical protein
MKIRRTSLAPFAMEPRRFNRWGFLLRCFAAAPVRVHPFDSAQGRPRRIISCGPTLRVLRALAVIQSNFPVKSRANSSDFFGYSGDAESNRFALQGPLIGENHRWHTHMPDYIPSTDADLLAFSSQFSTKITATPVPLGVTAAIATQLATYQSAYATALAASTNPQTRGPSTVFAKNQARVNLVAYCRHVAGQVQGTMSVTAQQKQDLGLTVRDVEPSPIPPPANAPGIMIKSTIGNTIRIKLIDTQNPTRRGRPDGVDGASVFSFVGEEAPTTEAGWKFEGNTSRTVVDITFPNTVAPGAKVWVTAFWFNPRALSGPACMPVGANLPGGAAMAA